MRHIGRAVFGADGIAAQRGFDIAVVAPDLVQPLGGKGICHGLPMLRLLRRVGRGTPFAGDGVHRLEGAPGVVRHHGHAARHGHDLLHAAQAFGTLGIKADQRATLARIDLDGGMQHALHAQIDAVAQRAGGLGRHVQPRHGLADQAPLAGVAQRDLLHRLFRCGECCQLGVGQALPIRQHDGALVRLELVNRHARLLRCGALERLACDRTGMAQLDEAVCHGAGAARHLQAHDLEQRAHGGTHGFGRKTLVGREKRHLLFGQRTVVVRGAGCARVSHEIELPPVQIQLFGDQRGLHRAHALADIGMRRDQRDAVGIDFDPRVEDGLARLRCGVQRVGWRFAHQPGAEGHASGKTNGADEKAAAGDGGDAAHRSASSSFAAACTASRMRG